MIVDLDQVEADWESGSSSKHIHASAQHYDIFTHLFGNAYFKPIVNLNITYDYDEDTVSPVYRGNTIKPKEVNGVYTLNTLVHLSERNCNDRFWIGEVVRSWGWRELVVLKYTLPFIDGCLNSTYLSQAAGAPSVQFSSEPDNLWTLILTNPDGNLIDNDLECLHWFV